MRLAVISGVMLCCSVMSQTTVTINAISPCIMNFTVDPLTGQNLMSGCTSSVPGANITSSDWSTCFMMCCPGLVRPANSTFDDVQSCISTYASQPFLVTLIGILIGLLLLLTFVCIPCICSKDGVYQWMKRAISERFSEENQEEEFPEDLSPMRDNNKSKSYQLKNTDQLGSQLKLQDESIRVSLSDEIIDEVPSEERLCVVCGDGKSNLLLNCKHSYHSHCLPKVGELQKCMQCSSDRFLPARGYCCICERRYGHINHIGSSNHYICRTCDEK